MALTDILHPHYMDLLVREDGWGHPIVYQVTGPTTFRLVSPGPDGREGTNDDIVLQNGAAATP